MYALAFYPYDRDLVSADRAIRNWLGENAVSGTWQTGWVGGNRTVPIEFNAVTAIIEDNDVAVMCKLWWPGKTKIIATYNYIAMLDRLNLSSRSDAMLDFISLEFRDRMWSDGIVLYYTDEDDLVFLKMRWG